MKQATQEFLTQLDTLAAERREEIRSAPDELEIRGNVYYVSAEGDDAKDGRSPEHAWRTLARVSEAELLEGDGVRFRRGDVFRGFVKTVAGVTYCAYGQGEKPRLYGWDFSLADPDLWELYDEAHSIWHMKKKILDCGTLVFNDGEAHCRKLIPSYIGGRFVCRDDESREFSMGQEMTRDLDLFCHYDQRLTETPSKGQTFPVPLMDRESLGDLYLRCDRGNPARVFDRIEAVPRRAMIQVGRNDNVRVDNLCLKYIGVHAVSGGGHVKGLHVSNCEIGWVGGTVQNYLGTDPNYPQGGRGTVTRFGNGVEIYGGCEDYRVENCYIYQMYDAGITHQVTTRGNRFAMKGVRYTGNLVEYCVYSIEYFLEKNMGDTESYMEDIEIDHNILRFSGYGWGQQRHNVETPAHIKGWSYENTAGNYRIHHNLFDRAAYRMVHLVAKKAESCPRMWENTYVQHMGATLGQYGANEITEPPILPFDESAKEKIERIFGEENPTVYVI